MRPWLFALSAVLCLSLAAGIGSAATYYVSPVGDDLGVGSAAAPWLTLQHAVDSIGPGDTILVASGAYVGCRIESSGTAGAPCTLQADTGATVLVTSASASSWHNSNLEVEGNSYWVIDGLESAGSARYGIDVRVADHITVRNCHVHDAAVTGIFLAFADYALVEDNDTHNNGEHGIYNSNSADYVTLRGNRSHSNYGCGIHNNGDASMGGDGQISYATIEQNVIWDNGLGGGAAINCDGVSDSIIRNNLIYGNHAGGITLYAIDATEGSSRDKVYHNTIVQPADGRWAINVPASTGPVNPTGNSLVNNIIWTYHSWRGAITVWGPGALAQSDYNAVIDRFSADDDSSVIDLAAWQALGFDAHSFLATPDQLFVDAAANDFHLRPDAPAVDAGTALAEVTNDLTGAPRPQGGGPDIGCYELPTGDTFWDVPADFWAYDEIEACAAAGLVQGYKDGSYQPKGLVNRAQMAVYIARALCGGEQFVPTGFTVADFPDVPPDHWAFPHVEYAFTHGVVTGYQDGTYQPTVVLNRGQMAAFLARAKCGGEAYVPTGPTVASFPDVPTDAKFFRHVEYIYARGITTGYSDKRYHPEYACRRDQMAVFVARAFLF